MGITKEELRKFGFRPIDTSHRTFTRLGSYIYAHPYYDNLSVLSEDYYKCEVREEPYPPDWTNKDWTVVYQIDELLKIVNGFTFYENWRKINGFDPSWGLTKESFRW